MAVKNDGMRLRSLARDREQRQEHNLASHLPHPPLYPSDALTRAERAVGAPARGASGPISLDSLLHADKD